VAASPDPSEQLASIQGELSALRRATEAQVAALQTELAELRQSVWASKVTNLGDRLLVGCRHRNLVFYIDARDKVIGPRFVVDGEYEPATTKFVMSHVRPDDTCIDVGANFGYYTCLFAHLAWKGHVIGFEADRSTFEMLVDNVAINWSEHVVRLVNTAVAAETGRLTMQRWIDRPANTGVLQPLIEVAPGFLPRTEEFEVDTVDLDSFVDELDRVDLVKIDVEGGESLVVKGMSELVAKFRPAVLLEWSPTQIEASGSTTRELVRSIEGWEMPAHVIQADGTLLEISYDDLANLPYQNIVVAPTERVAR
jgi:FkbM family methyltransferase